MATLLHELFQITFIMANDCNTILIIEDDEGIRNAIKLILEFGGYRVETAANGKEGLDRLAAIETPCLILLDLMMPVMDGWAFADAMKKDTTFARIPITVVTAFAEKTHDLSNVSHTLKKPVEIDTLLNHVKEYCA
jgi:CheY-like chemotaxis protein